MKRITTSLNLLLPLPFQDTVRALNSAGVIAYSSNHFAIDSDLRMRDCIERVEFIFQRDTAIVGDEACFVRCGDHSINRYVTLTRFSSARPITSLAPVVAAFKTRGFMIDQPPTQIYEPEAAKPFEMIGGPEYAGRHNARLH